MLSSGLLQWRLWQSDCIEKLHSLRFENKVHIGDTFCVILEWFECSAVFGGVFI